MHPALSTWYCFEINRILFGEMKPKIWASAYYLSRGMLNATSTADICQAYISQMEVIDTIIVEVC